METQELTNEVRQWIKEHIIQGGYFDVTAWAENWGKQMGIYGIAVKDSRAGIDDDLDAFRHAFVSCVLVAWTPFAYDKEIADQLGRLNEKEAVGGESAESCPKYMDLHNNRVGREIAPDSKQMFYILATYENPNYYIAKMIAAAVKAGDTINSFDDPRMPKRCHAQTKLPGGVYRWRTKSDKKVRLEHAMREGQIFRVDNPPQDGNPGTAYGCRCVAEPINR